MPAEFHPDAADRAAAGRPIRRLSWLALFILLAGGCGRDDEPAGAAVESGQRLYPGASVIFPFERRQGVRLDAERGRITWTPDGQSVAYTAPLEPGTYAYSIVDSETGEELLANAVNVVMEPAASLSDVEVSGRALSARYGDVTMTAELQDGKATATWSAGSPASELVVTVDEDEQASLTHGGQAFDGYGALSPEEAAALDRLTTGPLGRAITMVPLDLGCADGVEETDDLLFAPVLLPWQMILKYEIVDRAPVIREFFSDSACGFPGFFETTTDKPFNSKVLWDVDHSVPAVHLVFPLDGYGQLSVEER